MHSPDYYKNRFDTQNQNAKIPVWYLTLKSNWLEISTETITL